MLGSRRGQCVLSLSLGPRPSIPVDSVTHVVNIPVDSRASALDTSFCSPPSYRPAPVRWGFFFYAPEIFSSIPDPDPNNAPKWPRPDSRTASKASRTEVPEKMAPEHRPSDATERAPRPSNKNRHRSEVRLTKIDEKPPTCECEVCHAICCGDKFTLLDEVVFISIHNGTPSQIM
jgi:hypothetical protein